MNTPWNQLDVQNFIKFVRNKGGDVLQVYSTSGGYVFDVQPPRNHTMLTENGDLVGPAWAQGIMNTFEGRGRRP